MKSYQFKQDIRKEASFHSAILNDLKSPLQLSFFLIFIFLFLKNMFYNQLLNLAIESVDEVHTNIAVSDHNFEASVTSET
jgi:hypothetical protein